MSSNNVIEIKTIDFSLPEVDNSKIHNLEGKIYNLESSLTDIKHEIKNAKVDNIKNSEHPDSKLIKNLENKIGILAKNLEELKNIIKKTDEKNNKKFNELDLVKTAIETSIEKGMRIEVEETNSEANVNKSLIVSSFLSYA